MADEDGVVVCRECDSFVRLDEKHCSECGTRVRSLLALAALLVVGGAVLGFSVAAGAPGPAVVGAIVLGLGGYATWDRRGRVRDARDRLEQ